MSYLLNIILLMEDPKRKTTNLIQRERKQYTKRKEKKKLRYQNEDLKEGAVKFYLREP